MGNKCTCFNQLQDQQTCDLSNAGPEVQNKHQVYKSSLTDDISNNNIPSSSMINKESQFVIANKVQINNKDIDVPKVKNIQKNVKGFLLRKNFNSDMKKQYESFTDLLYNRFVNEIAANKEVNNALYKPPSSTYIATTWSQFYTIDPTLSLCPINSNPHYKNGIIIEYKDKSFHSDDIDTILSNAVSMYKGSVILNSNIKDGIGELTYRDGSQLFGTWCNNQFTGWNRKITTEGTLFIGLFKNGILNGKGLRYSNNNNHLYKGDFVNDLREGMGIDESSGAKYIGDFVADKKTGKGKITFESGDTYEGDFVQNAFNGNGHYKWKNGHEYIGEYKDGMFNGKGLYKWSEKEYYKGDYKNGIKEGNGELKYPTGKKFICPFVNGKPNGVGTYEDGKGNKCQVEFVDGKINKKYKPGKKRS